MDHFTGLDVSTSVCIVEDARRIVREVNMASEAFHFKPIGLKSGYLTALLTQAGLPVISVEMWHMRAVLNGQIS